MESRVVEKERLESALPRAAHAVSANGNSPQAPEFFPRIPLPHTWVRLRDLSTKEGLSKREFATVPRCTRALRCWPWRAQDPQQLAEENQKKEKKGGTAWYRTDRRLVERVRSPFAACRTFSSGPKRLAELYGSRVVLEHFSCRSCR